MPFAKTARKSIRWVGKSSLGQCIRVGLRRWLNPAQEAKVKLELWAHRPHLRSNHLWWQLERVPRRPLLYLERQQLRRELNRVAKQVIFLSGRPKRWLR